ncbi:hypothetical protein ACFL09_06150 [Planctomycetota bacterium]
MKKRIELSALERERLNRILACDNLEKQKYHALALFVAAAALFFSMLALGYLRRALATHIGLAIFASGLLAALGGARPGYYKLFRIIHALSAEDESAEHG